MRFFDSHSHFGMLKHATLAEILGRCQENGVERSVTVSTNERDWDINRDVAQQVPWVSYSLGVHPHEATEWPTCEAGLRKRALAKPDKLVAIGETGLDYFYDNAPREAQMACFEGQARLAKELGLPLVIHCREAFVDLFSIVEKVGLGKTPGVMHCFTGTLEEAFRSVDLGFKISFSGILTFKNAAPLREVAKALPPESLMIETDCPFLTPMPFRGKPNEPFYVRYTAECLAETRGVGLSEIAELTFQNAEAVF